MIQRFRFKAEIINAGGGGMYVQFPHAVEKEFGTRGRVPVKVTFDGEPYRGSLIPMGGPRHIIGILKAIRERLGKGEGDSVMVVLERDTEERVVEVPCELQAALKKNRRAGGRFEAMSYTHRREWARFVGEAKNPETRSRRAAKAVEEILAASAPAAEKKAKKAEVGKRGPAVPQGRRAPRRGRKTITPRTKP